MKTKIVLIVALILGTQIADAAMHMHALCTEFFKRYYILTEYYAYTCLQEHPLENNVDYVAVPWTALLKKNKLDLLPHIKLQGGCTVCTDIHFERIFPILKKMGIDTLFTPHAEKKKTCEGITILPFPHFAPNGGPPKKKKLLYSFVGNNTKRSLRSKLLLLPERPDTLIIVREKGTKVGKKEKIHYRKILARSRFSLCPRGTGPSTIRFWESLQAGAIPVLISDNMLLPEGFDWDSCIIRVPEKDILLVDQLIANIPPEAEQQMRQNCLKAYEQFAGDNLVSVIRDYYNQL